MAIPDAKILAVQFFAVSWLKDTYGTTVMTKRYNLQQKCLKKWIGSALLGTRWYNIFNPGLHGTPTFSATYTSSQTDRQTEDSIMTMADHTASISN